MLSVLFLFTAALRAETMPPIEFTRETLDNGLTVVYAPMHNAPVVHVRVVYHVGSRNEKEDRQGFAHMFEHMMFRGSAHVAPEEHMKTISALGGNCNAFTSFDETVYVNTLPTTGLQTTLYLEADRMASFKVNDTIFQTERKVVAEEWTKMRVRQPAARDALSGFHASWRTRRTVIDGRRSEIWISSAGPADSELQEFFQYVLRAGDNACLVIAGRI